MKNFFYKKYFIIFLIITIMPLNLYAKKDPLIKEKRNNELCKTKELMEKNKTTCVDWCKKPKNWNKDCESIGVNTPNYKDTDGLTQNDNENTDDIDINTKVDSLVDRLKKKLKTLNPENTIQFPDNFTGLNSYSFSLQFKSGSHSELNPILFSNSEDFDKKTQSEAIKTIILDSFDLTNSENSYETALINFRNNWLGFEAKGSIQNKEDTFEPTAFHALAITQNNADKGNQTLIHKLYSLLGQTNAVYADFSSLALAIASQDERKAKLKDLHSAIKEYLKINLNVQLDTKKWEENTELSFKIRLGQLEINSTLSNLNVNNDFFSQQAIYDRYKDFLNIPTAYYTKTDGSFTEDESKNIVSMGMLVVNKIDLNPNIKNINPRTNVEWTADEMQNSDYFLYMQQIREIESNLNKNIVFNLNTGVEQNSLIDEILKTTVTSPANNVNMIKKISNNLITDFIDDAAPSIQNIHKIVLLNDKILIIFKSSDATSTNMTPIQWIMNENSFLVNAVVINSTINLSDISNDQGNISLQEDNITPLENRNVGNLAFTLDFITNIHNVNMIKAKIGGNAVFGNLATPFLGNIQDANLGIRAFLNNIKKFNEQGVFKISSGTNDREKMTELATVSTNLANLYYYFKTISSVDQLQDNNILLYNNIGAISLNSFQSHVLTDIANGDGNTTIIGFTNPLMRQRN